MNRVLRHQLRKYFADGFSPANVKAFLDAVSATYDDSDEHARRLVHSIEEMSDELVIRNAQLRTRHHRLAQLHGLLVELARGSDASTDCGGSPKCRFRRLTETVADAVGVAFASVWSYDGDALTCLDRFDAGSRSHSAGAQLDRASHPPYFAAVEAERTIAVCDVSADPRTDKLFDDPTKRGGIRSLLDVGAYVNGTLVGVLCLGDVAAREWASEEIAFASSAADLVALVFESSRRRDAEHALDAQRAFLRQVIDLIPNLVFAKDRDGRFVLVNDATATVYGTTVADLLGKRDADFNPHPDQVAHFRAIDLDVLDSGSERSMIEQITDADGRERWLHTTKRPIIEADGRAHAVLGVAVDITEQRRAERERIQLEANLRQAQKLESLGLLAGGIAHDLNNFLTPILMTASMVLEDLDVRSPLHADMADVVSAAESARDLTRQLLAFGRKQVLSLATIDLNDVIAKTLKMVTRLVPAHTRLEWRPAPQATPVKADAAQLQQVLINLVMNACDAMPSGGILTIATETIDDDVVLVVSDTGTGMTEQVLAHLFDPFFTTKELGRGTGLGLATVHGIVEQHHGRIAVASELGRGTRFEIRLPRRDRISAPVAVQSAAITPTGKTILLVEDESPIRRLITRVLTAEGYTVLAAQHAEEALTLANTHAGAIDLLLTDVVLPGASGPKLYAELCPRITSRVLFISGHARDAFDSLKPGTALLHKPFTASDLSARVRALLA